jgi:hypothetical protein
MRAVCESCEATQPADWKSGDLCSSCGAIARREKRCHWCVQYTPDGRFCRSCGGETVSDEHFGAARMLKASGVDQFSIPERLAKLDTEHVEHLTRLYQRHATLVARHVDDLRFVENYLLGSGWSQEVDDELTAQLPLSDEQFGALSIAVPPGLTDAATMHALNTQSPIALTSLLSSMAIVRNGWITDSDQSDQAISAFGHADVRIADESALALGHWRARFNPAPLVSEGRLVEALSNCTRTEDAAIALRMLGEPDEVDPSWATSDTDRAFAVALALGQIEPLVAALKPSSAAPKRPGDPEISRNECLAGGVGGAQALLGHDQELQRFAAAFTLARLPFAAPLLDVLAGPHAFDEDQIERLLMALRRHKTSFPELRASLWTLARGGKRHLREEAVRLLHAEGRADDALELVSIEPNDRGTLQLVLQGLVKNETEPTREATAQRLAHWMIENDLFATTQYGVVDLAKAGLLPDSFVPSVWSARRSEEQALQLLRFAEEQLEARGNESLHRFVVGVAWGDEPITLRAQAQWVLLRWYPRTDFPSKGPLVLEESVLKQFFGSVDAFVDRFVATVNSPDLGSESTIYEMVSQLIRYSPAEGLPGLARLGASFERFVTCVEWMVCEDSLREDLRCSAVRFLEHLVGVLPQTGEAVLELLDSMDGTEIEFECSTTANRIRGN